MDLLQLKNINKYYKLGNKEKFHALKNINVAFNKGELVSIIGESGSGKSTMMNLIGGLDSDFTGQLLINGKNIEDFKEKELDEYRKKKIGFVFQSCNLIPHLSILDNVTIALTLSNVSKDIRIKKATQVLKEVGLEDHINKKPNQLSGGQKQRVAIARALVNDPEIILADEPTGALDSETTEQVLNIIKDIAKKGKLVIMVTHSEKVAAYSSRIIKIFDGEIVEDKEETPLNNILFKNIEENKSNKNLSFFSAIRLAANNMNQKLKRNILVILITHYMDEAAEADRVVVMDGGKVILEGIPRDVFSQVKKMKDIGLDVPQVTELCYELQKAGIKIDTKILNVNEMVSAICQLK